MSDPQPNPSPANRQRDVITKFREEYEEALVEARVSADHTATEGWQRLYVGQRKHERDGRRELATFLKDLAERMAATGLGEEGEKQLSGIKKDSEALRQRQATFELQAIDPVKAPVLHCHKLIDEARRAARDEEERTPLLNVGLEDLMKAAIGDVKRVKWDEETGRVVIGPPERA